MDFKKILNSCWWKLNFKKTHLEIFQLEEKGIDVDEILKDHFAQDISKKIMNKVEIIKEDSNVQNFSNEPFINYKTEIVILNKQELFELFYSFNQLTDKQKQSALEFFSPSEEYYMNQVRYDRLEEILNDNFLPTLDNI
jgi:hypothetical protein